MALTLDEFENVCKELSTAPTLTTKWIQGYQDTDGALLSSIQFIESKESVVQFQALLICQYSYLKQKDIISLDIREYIRMKLWTFISQRYVEVLPFALNKAMQVYSMTWKTQWNKEVDTRKMELFNQISTLLHSHMGVTLAAKLLQSIVESFNNRSRSERTVSLDAHREAHCAFEALGLDFTFQACMQLLEQALRNTGTIATTFRSDLSVLPHLMEALNALTAVGKLFVEVMQWECGTCSFSLSGEVPLANLCTPPSSWGPVLQQAGLVTMIWETYSQVSSIAPCIINAPTECLNGMASTIRILQEMLQSLAAVSMTSEIFQDDIQRVNYGENLLNQLTTLLDSDVKAVQVMRTKTQFEIGLFEEEVENITSILLRLIGNFKIDLVSKTSSFNQLITILANCCITLSDTLMIKRKTFDSWEGDVLNLLLEAWSLVLGIMEWILPISALIRAVAYDGDSFWYDLESSHGVETYKSSLRDIACKIFVSLFDCILKSELSTALCEIDQGNEDEQDEHETIDFKNMTELIQSICVIGRASLASALNHCLETQATAIRNLEQLLSQQVQYTIQSALVCMETLRVCVLFIGQLCIDNFQQDSFSLCSDPPLIPPALLDCLQTRSETFEMDAIVHSLQGVAQMLASTLQLQTRAVQLRGNTSDSTVGSQLDSLMSPLIMKLVTRLLSDYIRVYVEPDPSLYSSVTAIKCKAAFSLHGPEFYPIIALLLSSSYIYLVHFPFQKEVISSIADVLVALSSKQIVSTAVSASSEVEQLFGFVCESRCRLSEEGLTEIWGGLCRLAARGGRGDLIRELCAWLLNTLNENTSFLRSGNGRITQLTVQQEACLARCMANMAGVAKCPTRSLESPTRVGFNNAVCINMIIPLFDNGIPLILDSITAGLSVGSTDRLIQCLLALLRDFAEAQLNVLPLESVTALYKSAASTIWVVSQRIDKFSGISFSTIDAKRDEESFQLTVLLLCLQFLNHLSIKDFIFSDDDDGSPDMSGEVSHLIFLGLEMLIPRLSLDLLHPYPELQEKYFSLLVFMVNSYPEVFTSRLQAAGESAGSMLLRIVVEQCIWSAGSSAGNTARLALETLQSLTSFHMTSLIKGCHGLHPLLGAGSDILLAEALSRLLQLICCPSAGQSGISADRVDATANALKLLIACNFTRFNQFVNQFVSTQPVGVQESLMKCFERLVTNRGVNVQDSSRQQKLLFVQNMRDFVVELRANSSLC